MAIFFSSNCRTVKSGGGVAIYLDNKLTHPVRDDLLQMSDVVESIFIEVGLHKVYN